MGWRISRRTRLGRRTFLATLGSGVAVAAGPASAAPLVIQGADGGFVISGGGQTWSISGEALQRAWGPNASAVVTPDTEGRFTITIVGELLARSEAVLRLTVRPLADGRWTVQTTVTVPTLGTLSGDPSLGASGLLLSKRVSAGACLTALGLRLDGGGNIAQLELGRDLVPNLTSSAAFVLPQGIRVSGRLWLMSGAGEKPAAQMESGAFTGRARLGQTHGQPIDIESVESGAVSVLVNGTNRLTRIEGVMQLSIGTLRLLCGRSVVESRDAGQEIGRWSIDAALRPEAQRISTRAGRLVVRGRGGSDIHIEGRWGAVDSFSVKAGLVHSAMRLPLSDKTREFVDLGRLDFSQEASVRFTVGSPSTVTSSEGRVPLDGGAAYLPLEHATLWVRRDVDLLDARFRFRGLELRVIGQETHIVPSALSPTRSLIVELPPQHVQEQAFARLAPVLPGRALEPQEFHGAFEEASRRELQVKLKKDPRNEGFSEFCTKYEKVYREKVKGLPDTNESASGRQAQVAYPSSTTRSLEAFYVGREGLMTPLGRQVAREVATEERMSKLPKLADLQLGLSEVVVGDILRRHFFLTDSGRPIAGSGGAPSALSELLAEAAKRSGDLARVLNAASQQEPKIEMPFLLATWRKQWLNELRKGSPERAALESLLSQKTLSDLSPLSETALQKAFLEPYETQAPKKLPIEAQASGPTRLVFDFGSRVLSKGLAWSLEALLDWGQLKLRVSTRSSTTADDAAGPAELEEILKHQQIAATKSLQDRMAEIRKRTERGPGSDQTAIEVPARLVLSPATAARFLDSPAPKDGARLVPVWHADLREPSGKPFTLRAIHSEDFKWQAFGDKKKMPERGTQAGKRLGPLFALDDFDRHQLVALSSVYGLPVLARRSVQGATQTSQVSPPKDWIIQNGISEGDAPEQALYVPQPLPTRLLRLSSLGASLDLEATFIPPASLRDNHGNNAFDAFSLERWRSRLAGGREIATEVVYKGFLYPLGVRASLVKVTERKYLPWRPGKTGQTYPVAYLIQRLFIQVSKPTKTFPAVAQPFEGRGWPARALTVLTRTTPDLVDPTRTTATALNWKEDPSGRLASDEATGLVFWPRTSPGAMGNVRFRLTVDDRPEPISMPLLFVDNQAAHDPHTMRLLQRYYNLPPKSDDAVVRPAWEALRRLDHAGARRRYAPEGLPGDTTFETLTWDIRADSRSSANRPAFTDQDEATLPSLDGYRVNSAMESDDQPPFYPRCDLAQIRHDASARFSGNPQPPMPVRYWKRYLEVGLPIVSESEWNNGTLEAFAKARADVIEKLKELKGEPDRDMVMREAFLTVVSSKPLPKLSMGDNGDRSGGVARPEVNIAAVSRSGPIGVKKASDPPPADNKRMTSDFVDESSATVAGIVKIATLLESAMDAVSPQLRDTLEYAAGKITEQTKLILSSLDPLLAKFDSEQVLVTAYAPTRRSLEELRSALKENGPASIIAAVRAAAQEIERLAAAPLTPLIDAAETGLRATQQSFLKQTEAVWVELVNSIAPDAATILAIAQVLLPTVELEAELERIVRSKAENQAAAQVLSEVRQSIRAVSWELLSREPSSMPATLQELRQIFGGQLKERLPQLAAADAWKRDVIGDFVLRLHPSLEGAGPAVLQSIYAAIRRWRMQDMLGALAELQQDELALLRGWAKSVAGGICSAPSEVKDAIEALQQGLMPRAKIPSGCSSPVCASSADLGSFCKKLLNLCAKLPSMEPPSTDLALALDGFRSAVETLKPNAATCDALIKSLRNLRASHALVLAAGRVWVDKLSNATEAELQSAGVDLLTPILADLLDTVVPQKLEKAWTDHLADVVGTELAGVLAARFLRAFELLEPLSTNFRNAKTIGNVKKIIGEASKAIDALNLVGEDATASVAIMLALPVVSVGNGWAKATLEKARDGIDALIKLRDEAKFPLQNLDKKLSLEGEDALTRLLVVSRVESYGDSLQDRLLQESAFLHTATAANAVAPLSDLLRLLTIWQGSRPAAIVLVEALDRRLLDALRARALRVLNVDELRKQLEEMLRSALPTKRKLEYNWTLKTGSEVKVGLATVNMPLLKLNVSTTLDLQQPAKPAELSLFGKLDPFSIQIGEWIKLKFSDTTFTGGAGRDVTMSAPRLLGFEPQPKLMFLAALAAYLGVQEGGGSSAAEPNGPYLIPRPGGGAGIKAGYRLSFGAVQLGNVAIFDLAFDAHAELPFNGEDGAVRILLSSPEKPFLITAAPYGGSGYAELMSGPEGKQRLNIALQWGGAAAVAYGPLRATGKVMTGFRVRSSGKTDPVLAAMFLAAFEGHIACFGIAGSFVVTMEYKNNRLSGTATLTYSFSVGPVKKEFSVSVVRNAGQKMGDKESASLEDYPGGSRIFPAQVAGAGPLAELSSDVPAGMENWKARTARFAHGLPARGRRLRS